MLNLFPIHHISSRRCIYNCSQSRVLSQASPLLNAEERLNTHKIPSRKIGSENMDSISNVLFDNCIIKASNRGLGIQNRDEGTVSNVVFSNMIIDCKYFSDVWWGKAEPIYVTSYPRAVGNHKDAGWRFPKGATEGRCGEVSEIYFHNVKCYGENGCFIGGDTPDKVNNIYLDNIDLALEKRTDYPGNQYDKRPCVGEGFVESPAYGVYVDTASDIFVEGLRVKVQVSFPAERFGGEIKRINVK